MTVRTLLVVLSFFLSFSLYFILLRCFASRIFVRCGEGYKCSYYGVADRHAGRHDDGDS